MLRCVDEPEVAIPHTRMLFQYFNQSCFILSRFFANINCVFPVGFRLLLFAAFGRFFRAIGVLPGLSIHRHGKGGIVIRKVAAVDQRFSTGLVE